jgi:hypothetical protein
MGMFEDEAKKMDEEATAAVGREEQQRAELRQIARKVGEDLASYIGNHQLGKSFELNVHENMVSVRKRTTSDTMDVKCRGRENFEIYINGELATGTDQSQMVRGVIQWLER